MGGFLEKPITEKVTQIEEGNGLKTCAVAMQGWRSSMEDAHILHPEIENFESCSYFSVFDGHGGDFCSKYAYELLFTYSEEHMMELLKEKINNINNTSKEKMVEILKDVYLKIDDDLRNQEQIKNGDRSGCTAVSVFLTKTDIFCANSGDSRSVMYRDGQVVELSHDHKPYNEEEKKRIMDAGGCVVMKRVNGDLAVSRAFGDFCLKNNPQLTPQQQQVTAFPDLITEERTGKEEFIIIACDGIWDVIDNQAICDKIKEELECEPDIRDVVSNILDHCLEEGSKDNMSLILILFGDHDRTIPEKVEKRKKENEEKRIKREEEERRQKEEAENMQDDQNTE